MNDYGLYQEMVQRLKMILPQVFVGGCAPSEQESPPYVIIQQAPLERAPLPHRTGRRTVTVEIVSRYRGNTEILAMIQQISVELERKIFSLTEGVLAFLKLEETSCVLEKDQITRRAKIIFSALLRFKS